MEARKERLTLPPFQRRLKVWRSRASSCPGAVKPPSTGRLTKGEADARSSTALCAIANNMLGAPSGRYAVRPRLRARGFSRRASRQGQTRENQQRVFQAAWHAPAQVVAVKVQRYQIGEAAQLRRYLPWANHVQSPQSREKWHAWDSTVGPLSRYIGGATHPLDTGTDCHGSQSRLPAQACSTPRKVSPRLAGFRVESDFSGYRGYPTRKVSPRLRLLFVVDSDSVQGIDSYPTPEGISPLSWFPH